MQFQVKGTNDTGFTCFCWLFDGLCILFVMPQLYSYTMWLPQSFFNSHLDLFCAKVYVEYALFYKRQYAWMSSTPEWAVRLNERYAWMSLHQSAGKSCGCHVFAFDCLLHGFGVQKSDGHTMDRMYRNQLRRWKTNTLWHDWKWMSDIYVHRACEVVCAQVTLFAWFGCFCTLVQNLTCSPPHFSMYHRSWQVETSPDRIGAFRYFMWCCATVVLPQYLAHIYPGFAHAGKTLGSPLAALCCTQSVRCFLEVLLWQHLWDLLSEHVESVEFHFFQCGSRFRHTTQAKEVKWQRQTCLSIDSSLRREMCRCNMVQPEGCGVWITWKWKEGALIHWSALLRGIAACLCLSCFILFTCAHPQGLAVEMSPVISPVNLSASTWSHLTTCCRLWQHVAIAIVGKSKLFGISCGASPRLYCLCCEKGAVVVPCQLLRTCLRSLYLVSGSLVQGFCLCWIAFVSRACTGADCTRIHCKYSFV